MRILLFQSHVRSFSSRLQRYALQCIMIFAIFLVQACNVSEGDQGRSAMTVGSMHVSLKEAREDFQELSKGLPLSGENGALLKNQIVQQIVERYLITEYGRRRGISISNTELEFAMRTIRDDYTEEGFREAILKDYIDLDQWKHQLRKRLLVEKVIGKVSRQVPPPSNKAILHYYEAHMETFYSGRQVEFRQIVTKDAAEARDLLQKLKEGADFARLAMKTSIAPEASKGGMVGWVTKGELESVMDKALFSLKPGQISSVIHSPYGYHIFQVLKTRPGGVEPLPEVSKVIESRLFHQRQRVFLRKWLESLRDHIKVHVNPRLVDMLERS